MSFLILQANNIKKSYQGREIIDAETISIYYGDRIGVVGANGAGKTTLLSILMGDILPDGGTVTKQYETVYLRQFDVYDKTLSGGENKKRRIVQNLQYSQQIIFADEPTANLDAEGVKWVKSKLEQAAAAVIVSHDRDLLDSLCNQIIEVKNGKIQTYRGNYSDYEHTIALGVEQNLQARELRDKKERQLKGAIQKKEAQVHRSNQRYKREKIKNSSEAILGKMRLASNQKKMQTEAAVLQARIDGMDAVFVEKKAPTIQLDFSLTKPPRNNRVITCSGLNFSYGKTQVLKDVSFVIEGGERVAITGKNGAGKTTLLNQIYYGNKAIHTVPKLKFGYLKQDFDQLEMRKTVLENVLETSVQTESTARNLLAGLLFYGTDVQKPAEVLSGGEKIKLALAKLLLSDCNALLLDEPTNFLDIPSLEALGNTLVEYPGTIILVSHDSRFRSEVATRELNIAEHALADPLLESKKRTDTDKILLDIKRTQLVAQLEQANAQEKPALESKYQALLAQIANS